MELLRSERDGPVAVGGVPQHGEASPDLRDWNDLDALGGHGVYRHARCTVPVVEQDLGEQAAEGVAHDDRRALELPDQGCCSRRSWGPPPDVAAPRSSICVLSEEKIEGASSTSRRRP